MLSNHPLETVSEDTIRTNHPLQYRRLLHRANSSERRKRIGRRDLYAPIPNPTPVTKSTLTASPGASIPNWMWRCKSPSPPPLLPPFPPLSNPPTDQFPSPRPRSQLRHRGRLHPSPLSRVHRPFAQNHLLPQQSPQLASEIRKTAPATTGGTSDRWRCIGTTAHGVSPAGSAWGGSGWDQADDGDRGKGVVRFGCRVGRSGGARGKDGDGDGVVGMKFRDIESICILAISCWIWNWEFGDLRIV